VTTRIEEAVSGVASLERLDSQSVDGLSVVVAQFALSRDPADATDDVREQVSRVAASLPAAARAARVETFRPNEQPIALLALRVAAGGTERSLAELDAIADRLVRRRLQSVDGVARVSILGSQARRVEVVPDPTRLARTATTVAELDAAIARRHVDAPGLASTRGERSEPVLLRGRAASIAELAAMPIAPGGRLGHVADVRLGVAPPESIARLDGRDGSARGRGAPPWSARSSPRSWSCYFCARGARQSSPRSRSPRHSSRSPRCAWRG
jgi:HAE1 family hydrophobic/amphiphilic exporter-1